MRGGAGKEDSNLIRPRAPGKHQLARGAWGSLTEATVETKNAFEWLESPSPKPGHTAANLLPILLETFINYTVEGGPV